MTGAQPDVAWSVQTGIDDDWSARTWNDSANPIWNGNRPYVKWPTVCETLPPEAFTLKRVNTGDGNDD